MNNKKYQIGERVFIKDCDESRMRKTVGNQVVILTNFKVNSNDYYNVCNVDSEDRKIDGYFHDQISPVPIDILTNTDVNPLIINSPVFNVEELPCGSLIYIKNKHFQLQGFVAAISPKVITIGYYDADSQDLKYSFEAVDIERVINRDYTVELIRKAIPLELQGV